jgi:hypothetical protein
MANADLTCPKCDLVESVEMPTEESVHYEAAKAGLAALESSPPEPESKPEASFHSTEERLAGSEPESGGPEAPCKTNT